MELKPPLVYRKFRTADDPKGNQAWAHKVRTKAFQQDGDTAKVEDDFKFNRRERLVWRLLKIPRSYFIISSIGVFEEAELQCFLRALIAADVLAVLDTKQSKTVLPIEIKRLKIQIKKDTPSEKSTPKPTVPKDSTEKLKKEEKKKASPIITPKKQKEKKPTKSLKTEVQKKETKKKETDSKSLAEEMKAALELMKNANYYAFLGVQETADQKEMKAAYLKKSKKLHPDLIASSELADDQKSKRRLEKIYHYLQDAYQCLSNASERKEYDALLKQGIIKNSNNEHLLKREKEAITWQKKAEILLKRKEFAEAADCLKRALKIKKNDPYLSCQLGLSILSNTKKEKEERLLKAEQIFLEITEKQPWAEAFYYLASIETMRNNPTKAQKYIEKTLKIDPKHYEANRANRLFLSRKEKTENLKQEEKKEEDSLKNRLSKFFKK